MDKHKAHTQNDIELFISSSILNALSHKAGFEVDHLKHVIKRLSDDSEGSFLWVGFIVKDLSEYETLREVTQTLNKTPKGLGPLYNRILLQIYGRHRAQRHLIFRLLAWVSLAFRPLTISELTRAVMGSVSCRQEGELTEFLSYCKHLLVVDDRKQTVRLVHASAKESLVTLPAIVLSNSMPDRTHVDVGHRMITRACLALLEKDDEYDALRQYAVEQWPNHIKACRPEDVARELTRGFFQDMDNIQRRWEEWIEAREHLQGPEAQGIQGNLPKTLPDALHAAAYWGITLWTEKLLLRPNPIWAVILRKTYLEAKDEVGMTPLMVAVKEGNPNMVRLLLQSGAVVSLEPGQSEGDPPPSALVQALECASDEQEFICAENPDKPDTYWPGIAIGKLLLQHLRKSTCLSMVTSAAFQYACALQHGEPLVRILLDHCTKSHTSDRITFACPALVEAARNGHAAVLKLLLDGGSDPESMLQGVDAFCAAILSAEPEILAMLLDKYDANCLTRAKDQPHVLVRPNDIISGHKLYLDWPVFHPALYPSYCSYSKVLHMSRDVRMLESQERLTPLFAAYSSDHCARVCLERIEISLLLQAGELGGPELLEALRRGRLSAAQILLENGIRPKHLLPLRWHRLVSLTNDIRGRDIATRRAREHRLLHAVRLVDDPGGPVLGLLPGQVAVPPGAWVLRAEPAVRLDHGKAGRLQRSIELVVDLGELERALEQQDGRLGGGRNHIETVI